MGPKDRMSTRKIFNSARRVSLTLCPLIDFARKRVQFIVDLIQPVDQIL